MSPEEQCLATLQLTEAPLPGVVLALYLALEHTQCYTEKFLRWFSGPKTQHQLTCYSLTVH
jgi:hypothetical protein